MNFINSLKEKLLLLIARIKAIFHKKAGNQQHPDNIQNIEFKQNIEEPTTARATENYTREVSNRASHYSYNHISAPSSPMCCSQILLDQPNSTNTIAFPQGRLLLHDFNTDSFDQDMQSIEDIYNLVINKLLLFATRSNVDQLSPKLIKQQLHNMRFDLNELTIEDLLEFKDRCINSQQNLSIITHPLILVIEDFLLSSNESYAHTKQSMVYTLLQAKLRDIGISSPGRITLNTEEIQEIFNNANIDLNTLSLESLNQINRIWDEDTICNQFVKFILEVKISSSISASLGSVKNKNLSENTRKAANFRKLFVYVLTSISNNETLLQSKKFYQEIFKNLININDSSYINVKFHPNKWRNLFDEYNQYTSTPMPILQTRQEIFEFQEYLIAVDAADARIPEETTLKPLSYWINSISSGHLSDCLQTNLVSAALIYSMTNFLFYKYLPKTVQNSPLLLLQESIELTLTRDTGTFQSNANLRQQYQSILQYHSVDAYELRNNTNRSLVNNSNKSKKALAAMAREKKNATKSLKVTYKFH